MYLTEIAEAIENALNTSPPEKWTGGLVVPTDMPVTVGFDPFSESDNLDPAIYILAGFNEYDLSKSRKIPTGKTGVTRTRRLTVIICTPFKALLEINHSDKDVSHKSEWTLLSNLREDLENFLVHLSISGVELLEIEPQPADEMALDNRIFLAPTTLSYRSC